jgi:hypothetical protein
MLQLPISAGLRTSGGEAGIRTLGTGVSPYNGLAKGSFSPPSLAGKDLQSEPRSRGRAESLSFGSYCAPLCAPNLRTTPRFSRSTVGLSIWIIFLCSMLMRRLNSAGRVTGPGQTSSCTGHTVSKMCDFSPIGSPTANATRVPIGESVVSPVMNLMSHWRVRSRLTMSNA